MKNVALLIFIFVLVSLYALGQENTKNNDVLFEDNDVDYFGRRTEDHPYIPLAEFNGDTTAFLKRNFEPEGTRHWFGFTNRKIRTLVDTLRHDLPVKTLHLYTNKYGLAWVFLYFDTPEKIHQEMNKGNEIQRLEIRIPNKTLKKRGEIIQKYIVPDKLLKWDDKYLKVLGGITYEYVIYYATTAIFN